ncbi:Protein of unknown function DUF2231, transmembrane [Crinalium epipsammum PCC 9333]|uniref:DUF2231 domain-containing protein n=1 Tax=Crinalium epipsammum PCC 9333 TaxID=1173022 RepID=K9W4T6_9CYAN|nr:DUF2231 domain-containing protein [Crinalium epipsammum]AFZ14465.1 Protein of unknown function DUF2231, transmembrane [Crinalium epipsammum PCC 9333]
MTQTPSVPPLIESDESDYRDSGVTSTVAVAGHPLHPLLVTLPITFLVTAPVTDIVYWLTSDLFWAKASYWVIVAGLATAVIAAITGLMDFLRIERVRKRKAGWAHMLLNVAVLALTIINLVVRLGDPSSKILYLGLTISVIVATLLGLSGWYGAELIYRHKVAVIGYGDPNR